MNALAALLGCWTGRRTARPDNAGEEEDAASSKQRLSCRQGHPASRAAIEPAVRAGSVRTDIDGQLKPSQGTESQGLGGCPGAGHAVADESQDFLSKGGEAASFPSLQPANPVPKPLHRKTSIRAWGGGGGGEATWHGITVDHHHHAHNCVWGTNCVFGTGGLS